MLTAVFFSCQQEIDDYYYKDTETYVDADVMSLIEANEEFSEYFSLLKEFQIDTLLSKGKSYTFFVPNNSAMEAIDTSVLDKDRLVAFLTTESYININQIQDELLIQSLGGKFASIQAVGDSMYIFDGVDILSGSPLSNNGRYYELTAVTESKPSLYQYIADTNPFYRAYLDSQDSIYLDKELSTPIGYTEDGLTIYDTIMSTINLFEQDYFEVKDEFRNSKATMLLFSQNQYDDALSIISSELELTNDVSVQWQNDILMPYLLDQSVFRGSIPFSSLSSGRARNILGDSVDVEVENIEPDFFECSNGRAYNYINFEVPEQLYKVMDTLTMTDLLVYKGSGLYTWNEEVTTSGDKFDPTSNSAASNVATFGTTLLVEMGKSYYGPYTFGFKFYNVFPATYKLTLRANLTTTGVYRLYVNGKQFSIDIGDGPYDEFDLNSMKQYGVVSSVVSGNDGFYPYEDGFCKFDVLIDNITEYGDVEVKLEYVEPSKKNNKKCGFDLDFISLEYFNDNN